MNNINQIAQERSEKIEKHIIGTHGTKSCDALRRTDDPSEYLDIRPKFFHDTDRIIHSKSYTRYIDKTQVFSLVDNDDITHRVLHVQLVSKIARVIGRVLELNEDLIEAIALGHDLGHPPFGHDGESYLDKICLKYKIGHFVHSVQSVTFLDNIEKRMEIKPLNLSLQVLDGILCHDGEIENDYLIPQRTKTWKTHFRERMLKIKDSKYKLIPMTLEGCVVRYADVISYIGRDIEDAITIKLIKREDIPVKCSNILGKYNRNIINTLVKDLIENSRNKDKICYSNKIQKALKELKRFNNKRIYKNPRIKTESPKIEHLYTVLFDEFLNDIKKKDIKSEIYTEWIERPDVVGAEYIQACKRPEIVRDYLASLTDDYLIELFNRRFVPKRLNIELQKGNENE